MIDGILCDIKNTSLITILLIFFFDVVMGKLTDGINKNIKEKKIRYEIRLIFINIHVFFVARWFFDVFSIIIKLFF